MAQNRRAEDYTKVIYRLRENGLVRGVDLARELGIKKPTVSVALKKMEARGFITCPSDRGIELTEEGERLARKVLERYDVLYGFLTDLGVDEQTAHEDACRMEHGISDAAVAALRELRQYLRDVSYRSDDGSL